MVDAWLKARLDDCDTNIRQICMERLGIALPLKISQYIYTPYWSLNRGLKAVDVAPRKVFDEEVANPFGEEQLLVAQLAVRTFVAHRLGIPTSSPLFASDDSFSTDMPCSDPEEQDYFDQWFSETWVKGLSQQLADCCLALQSISLKEIVQVVCGRERQTCEDSCRV